MFFKTTQIVLALCALNPAAIVVSALVCFTMLIVALYKIAQGFVALHENNRVNEKYSKEEVNAILTDHYCHETDKRIANDMPRDPIRDTLIGDTRK